MQIYAPLRGSVIEKGQAEISSQLAILYKLPTLVVNEYLEGLNIRYNLRMTEGKI